jgi:hypothetical protein
MMGLMTVGRRAALPISWRCQDLTIAEMLSDSIVQALMAADGVDPQVLQSELRSVARQLASVRGQEQSN